MVTLTIAEHGKVRIIDVIGRLDGDSAPELGHLLDQTLDDGQVRLVLDLGSVDYISSAGLREIVRIYKRAAVLGGELRIANPSDPVMTVMEMAGLDTALNLFRTRMAALQDF